MGGWRRLLDGGMDEEAAHGGASAVRGCLMGGWRRLQMGELPLRGAARSEEGRGSNWGSFRCAGLLDGGNGGGSTWGSFRCAGLLDGGMEEAVNGGAPAARGCSI